jgi:NAD-dependent SIR2 family protein deacetylase
VAANNADTAASTCQQLVRFTNKQLFDNHGTMQNCSCNSGCKQAVQDYVDAFDTEHGRNPEFNPNPCAHGGRLSAGDGSVEGVLANYELCV